MSAPKNYSVTKLVRKEDEPEIEALLKRYPLWTRKVARECVARKKFQKLITDAKKIINGEEIFSRLMPIYHHILRTYSGGRDVMPTPGGCLNSTRENILELLDAIREEVCIHIPPFDK